jgi:hypothetical protein
MKHKKILPPTVKEIRERWNQNTLPEMVFSGHVKTDVEVLLNEIDSLERSVQHFIEQEAGESI